MLFVPEEAQMNLCHLFEVCSNIQVLLALFLSYNYYKGIILNELKKKILWQCRRGLWELDAIFIPFVENNFDYLEEDEITNFQRLLEYEDIEIFDILVNKKSFEDTSLQPIVKKILTFHDLNLGTSS